MCLSVCHRLSLLLFLQSRAFTLGKCWEYSQSCPSLPANKHFFDQNKTCHTGRRNLQCLGKPSGGVLSVLCCNLSKKIILAWILFVTESSGRSWRSDASSVRPISWISKLGDFQVHDFRLIVLLSWQQSILNKVYGKLPVSEDLEMIQRSTNVLEMFEMWKIICGERIKDFFFRSQTFLIWLFKIELSGGKKLFNSLQFIQFDANSTSHWNIQKRN